MSETFQFWHQWSEIRADRVPRDFAELHQFGTYQAGLDGHRRACRGDWVVPAQAWPSVSELVAVSAGKTRTVRAGVQLWSDDRPPLSREGFSELWREKLGVMSGRMESVA